MACIFLVADLVRWTFKRFLDEKTWFQAKSAPVYCSPPGKIQNIDRIMLKLPVIVKLRYKNLINDFRGVHWQSSVRNSSVYTSKSTRMGHIRIRTCLLLITFMVLIKNFITTVTCTTYDCSLPPPDVVRWS